MNELNKALLLMLGNIYAATAVGYERLSLTDVLQEYIPAFPQKQALIRAIFETGILVKQEGDFRHPPVKWGKSIGAPSLTMVARLLEDTERVRQAWYQERKVRALQSSTDRWKVTVVKTTRKKPCTHCPFKRGGSACKFFEEQGFDCKGYNMETFKIIKDETGMG